MVGPRGFGTKGLGPGLDNYYFLNIGKNNFFRDVGQFLQSLHKTQDTDTDG